MRGTVSEFSFRNPHGVPAVAGFVARHMAATRRPGEHAYPVFCDPGYGE